MKIKKNVKLGDNKMYLIIDNKIISSKNRARGVGCISKRSYTFDWDEIRSLYIINKKFEFNVIVNGVKLLFYSDDKITRSANPTYMLGEQVINFILAKHIIDEDIEMIIKFNMNKRLNKLNKCL